MREDQDLGLCKPVCLLGVSMRTGYKEEIAEDGGADRVGLCPRREVARAPATGEAGATWRSAGVGF